MQPEEKNTSLIIPVIRINSQKNLAFYVKKCLQGFEKGECVELQGIGNATGMLVKVCEEMVRMHNSRILKLESLGFYDRKQYKKRKLKLVAKLKKQ